ncbi:MAG TPA: S41 family peptidase [Sphingomicrobium sp.]|nr:S41 family peptidase [Sphingomicrobium sp.]
MSRKAFLIGTAVAVLAGASLAQAQTAVPAPAPAVPSVHPLPAGALEPLDQGEGRGVAEKLAAELTDNFVYPEQGKRYATMLRSNTAAGRYDHGTRQELAERLTYDLQAIQKDGHLRVLVAGPQQEGPGGRNAGPPPGAPPLIQAAKEIAPGIAYIRFTAFLGSDEEVAAVRKFMADNKVAKTIIFDLRNHHGGGPAEMDEIFPFLFASKTPLVTLEMPRSTFDRRGSPFGQRSAPGGGPTMEVVKDNQYVRTTHFAIPNETTSLRDAKVYLLVSNVTGSAAEHFSLAFKSTGRATLIGEATAGANHFGGPMPLNEHFAVWMPVGRTYDIKTGKDWEGVGVAPDIAVDPTQALIVALEKAGLPRDEAERINTTEIPAEPVHRNKLRAR